MPARQQEVFDFRWAQKENINMRASKSTLGEHLLGFAEIEVPSGQIPYDANPSKKTSNYRIKEKKNEGK